MSDKKQILNNILSLTAGEIITKLVMFAYVFYLARTIGTEGTGILGFAQSQVAFFLLLSTFGLEVYGSREISKNVDQLDHYVNHIVSIKLVLSVSIYLCFAVFTYLTNNPDNIKIVMYFAGLKLFGEGLVLNWIYQALGKLHIVAIRQIVASLLSLVGILVLVNNSDDIALAALILSSSLIINVFWQFGYYFLKIGKIRFQFDKIIWFDLIRKSVPIGATIFMITIYSNSDMVMLGYLSKGNFAYDTGIYDAAHRFILIALVPSVVLQQSFFPVLARLFSIEEKHRAFSKIAKLYYLTGGLVAGIFFIFAEELILIQYGAEYIESANLLRIMAITIFLMYWNLSYAQPLLAWGNEKRVFYSTVSGAITNIILNFILIPEYGFYGAAIATIISEGAVQVGLMISMKREHKLSDIPVVFRVLFVALISTTPFYFIKPEAFLSLVLVPICVLSYIFVILLTKTLTISEIKAVFRK